VRAWFNTQAQAQTIARGRELVEKLLQREGRTALERDALAEQLGFKGADALYEVVGKDELSLRTIENLLRPPSPQADEDRVLLHRSRSEAGGGRGGVLVVGMDSLLTTLARCCRPAPPDAITGFVTRGRGVAVHRRDCSNLRNMAQGRPAASSKWPGAHRAATSPRCTRWTWWWKPPTAGPAARHHRGVCQGQDERHRRAHAKRQGPQQAWMTFTVEATDAARLAQVLAQMAVCRAYVTRGGADRAAPRCISWATPGA
jgi:GTP pyrophosphokinase